MKNPNLKSVLALASFLLLPAAGMLHAEGYSSAEITRTFNEVRVLKENAPPKTASPGTQIDPVTSVATGADSRAELRFPDKSLTRLGANSRFTLRGDKRTLDLDQGVMLLQVPKNIGGAKVRTAAVTAAVTGTTVMFEYQPSGEGDGDGFMKVICIEGSLDLSLNDDPSTFQTIKAGQLSISKLGSGILGAPVDVDLKVLLKTSSLLKEGEDTPNKTEVSAAVQTQQKELSAGTLVQTNLVIPGRGTMVVVDTIGNILNNLGFIVQQVPPPPPGVVPGGPTPPPPTNPGDTTPFTGFLPLIAGKSIIDNSTTIQTGPPTPNALNVFNLRQGTINVQGRQFLALIPFSVYGYGTATTSTQTKFNEFMYAKVGETGAPWAAFKFEDLFISGTPLWDLTNDTPAEDIVSVILSSLNGIRVGPESIFTDELPPEDDGEGGGAVGSPIPTTDTPFITLDLSASGLENFTLYAQNSPIIIASESGDTAIYGNGQNLAINAAGSDVWIEGSILLDGASPEGEYAGSAQLLIAAANNVNIGTDIAGSPIELGANPITIEANTIRIDAGNEVRISNSIVEAKQGKLAITARNKIQIQNSTQLKALMEMNLTSTHGDIDINNSDLTADVINLSAKNIMLTDVMSSSRIFQAQTLGTDGWIEIGGTVRGTKITASEFIHLYGGSATGGVRFIADSELDSPLVDIKGNTVEIVGTGTTVHVPQNNITIQANIKNYNLTGSGASDSTNASFGSFSKGTRLSGPSTE